MDYKLSVSVHKGNCSNSHLAHNRRTIPVPHADKNRLHLDTAYIDMSLEDAYHFLFDDALKEYNSNKKPSRQIKDYLAHITEQYEMGEKKLQEAKSRGASRKEMARIKSRYPKPFYEIIVSVGNCDAYDGLFACGGEKENVTVDILNEYMADFQKRNPHLFVFSAYIHRSEKNPHIHIDYIPWTDIDGRGLPKRNSENGAFVQQGLTSGKTGDIGTVAFQEKERQTLSEIARKHNIEIIEGKQGSKKHLSKEAYILRQEQEKTKREHILIENQAGELLRYQDELAEYLSKNGIMDSFTEHIENISLKQDKAQLDMIKDRNKKIVASAWQEYNDYTASFFTSYRENKKLLWGEIQKARETSHLNKKRLQELIYDITDGSDFFIVKLFKLFTALFVAIGNIRYDNELQQLEETNRALKQQAKEIMNQSGDVSAVLRTKQIDDIEQALSDYETALENATTFINGITQSVGLCRETEFLR